MLIQDVSVDCLELIAELIDAHDIGHLWCAGSKRLQRLLSEGGALRNLRFKFQPYFPLAWPKLIHQLPHLEHLSVHLDTCYAESLDFRTDMMALPRSVKSLDFDFPNAISHFNEVLKSYPARFSHLETLLIRQSASTEDIIHMDLSKMENLKNFQISLSSSNVLLESVHLPPHLTKLSVSMHSVTSEWFESLPSSLISLDLKIASPLPVFHLLPRQILDFTITCDKKFDTAAPIENWSSLPPNLTFLRIRSTRGFRPSYASHLPKTLTFLDLGLDDDDLDDDALLEIVKQLPPTMKEIGNDFGYLWPSIVSQEFALALPRTLHQSMMTTRVDYDAISSLPQGIQSIYVNPSSFSPNMTIPSFPLQLNSIYNFNLKPELMTCLPATVTHLECSANFPIDFTPAFSLALPRRLEILIAHGKENYPVNLIAESFKGLPRTLTELNLEFHEKSDPVISDTEENDENDENIQCNHDNTIREDEMEMVPAKAALNLPSGLKVYRITNLPLEPEFFSHLPLSLNSIDTKTMSIPDSAFEAFKRFSFLEVLIVETIHPPSNWKPILRSLPKKLQQLYWGQSDYYQIGARIWETNLENEDLALLPHGLTSLSLPASPYVNKEGLIKENLPKYLPQIDFCEL